MGGMDWSAVHDVAVLLGVHDVEILIIQLCAIRDHQRAQE